jgi:hypothetical protein
MAGMVEREEHGLVVLSPEGGRPIRRVLHVNAYGGRDIWRRVREGTIPGHQLLGCLELVRKGYEVALAEPIPDFYWYRRPVPHDLRLLRWARSWLGREGILYCGHNVLYWLPLLRSLGALRCAVVSLLYAREPLNFARSHTGVIGLTPAGMEQARRLAPQARVAHLGWGVDLGDFPRFPYQPEWLLSCGITNRDFPTLCTAAGRSRQSVRVICPGLQPGLKWPSTVTLIDGGSGYLIEKNKAVTIQDLLRDHFPRSAGTMVILKADPTEYTANGFTNLMEAMALGQPVIVTRTGALPGELDVERMGCGLHVPAGDPEALARAMDLLCEDRDRAKAMGDTGRRLCESHYNIERYATDLHHFFESL